MVIERMLNFCSHSSVWRQEKSNVISRTHTHTHTHIYIYIYIYARVILLVHQHETFHCFRFKLWVLILLYNRNCISFMRKRTVTIYLCVCMCVWLLFLSYFNNDKIFSLFVIFTLFSHIFICEESNFFKSNQNASNLTNIVNYTASLK